MNPKLYGIVPYDRSGKARWLLSELGIPFDDHWLNSETKEYEQASYLRINPMGRIPALEFLEQPMFESGAMCAFLADRYLEKGLAPPLNSSHRMIYQQWMYFAASTIDPFQTRIMIIEDIPAGEIHAQKFSVLMEEVKDAFTLLDQKLKDQDWLVPQQFTAADICVGYHLFFLCLWPEFKDVLDQKQNLSRYLERLKARPFAISSQVFSYSET